MIQQGYTAEMLNDEFGIESVDNLWHQETN
jgi:hypothetical protein